MTMPDYRIGGGTDVTATGSIVPLTDADGSQDILIRNVKINPGSKVKLNGQVCQSPIPDYADDGVAIDFYNCDPDDKSETNTSTAYGNRFWLRYIAVDQILIVTTSDEQKPDIRINNKKVTIPEKVETAAVESTLVNIR